MMQSKIIPNMGELLETLTQAVGESRETGETLAQIAHIVQTFLGADACIIFSSNPITRKLSESLIVTSNYALRDDELSAECMRSERLAQATSKQGQFLISDLAQAQWHEEEPLAALKHLSDVCSIACLALKNTQPQKPLGVLYLLYKTNLQFSTEDSEQFTILANSISFILQRAWLQYRYQEVARIGQEINHGLSDVTLLFQKLQRHIGRILDANYALLLFVYQPQGRTVDIYQAKEGHSIQERNIPSAGASHYVIETRETVFIRELSKEAHSRPFQIVKVRGTEPEESLIYVPLLLEEQPLGVLSIQHPQPNAYNHEDLFILTLLANHVALALYNTSLYNSMHRLNETGQVLTRQFASESTLQTIVDNIRDTTRANLVILYPYQQSLGRMQPPRFAGTLLNPESQQSMYPTRTGDLAMLALRYKETIFAQDSAELYHHLQGRLPHDNPRFYQRERIVSTAVIPLHIDESNVGVLFVNFRQPQSFDGPQRLLIEGLAHYASIAIKNSQIFGMLSERRLRELMILQKIDKALNIDGNLELKVLLETILKLAHDHIPVTGQSSIMLYNAQKKYFTQWALTGPNIEKRTINFVVPLEEKGIMGWVVKYKKPALVNDVHYDLPWRNIYVRVAENTTSELDVPLLDGNEVIGVLNFESPQKTAFRPEDEQFLVTLAGQAVLAIKKAQAYEREKRLADRFRFQYTVGDELAKITTLNELQQAYQTIIDIAQEVSQSPVVIRRFDEMTQALHLACASQHRYSPPSLLIALSDGYSGLVARERRTLVIDDIYELLEEQYPRPGDPTIRSLLIAPIVFKDRYYGNLELSCEAVAHFREKDKEFFESLAQQLGGTIYRLEITQERQDMEKRALAAEEMSSVGQSAFEITHRLGNELGLVESYVNDIHENISMQHAMNEVISKRLLSITRAARGVLNLSDKLTHEIATLTYNDEITLCSPRYLIEEVSTVVQCPDRIDLKIEIADDVSNIKVTRNLIIDILRNLIVNAIDAIPAPMTGCITLRAYNRGRYVILEVADTGTGILEDQQSKIFDLFYSTKQSSGFGLWSARRNALRNHGDLGVRSMPGQGTTFELRLPDATEIE